MTAESKRPIFFGADFADYPMMQAVAAPLTDRFNVMIGGRSGLSPGAGSDLPYFDWQRYQRLADFENDLTVTRSHAARYERVYAEARRQFTRALDRVFLAPLTAMAAERYFFALVTAFEDYLARVAEPMIVFFAHTPHFPWHLVFHHVCRRYGLPALILKQTQIPNALFIDRGIMCSQTGWLTSKHAIDAAAARQSARAVSPRLRQSIDINRRSEKNAYARLGLLAKLRLAWRYYRRRHEYACRHYFRQPWHKLVGFALERQRRRLADLAYLDRHAERSAPEDDFVYFALHYQPERTTVPEAGIYYDQIRAIRELAAALPSGWRLAVKEHPRQLGDRKPDLRSLHYPRSGLYAAIRRIPSAVLIHPFTGSDALVTRARLTASCNGSSVFQGLQHGVPGLTFVPTWHSGCASAPCVDENIDLAGLVDRLAAKPGAEVRADFERFIDAYAGYWFPGANDDKTAEKSGLGKPALIESTRRELRHWAERQACRPEARSGEV